MKFSSRRKTRRFSTTIQVCEPRQLLSASPIDGVGNNQAKPYLGSTDIQLLRIADAQYGDAYSSPAGADRPSAREVSNAVVAQDASIVNDRNLTDFIWIWGQFVDHDIDLTNAASPIENFSIAVPVGDPQFDPFASGTATIGLDRSQYSTDYFTSEGHFTDGIRQQINAITAFIDGSVVYGSDYLRANELRTFSGGRLKTSAGNLLPFNVNGFANAGGSSSSLFLAGDVRANENIALSSMHTIWVREHNRIVDQLSAQNPSLSDQELYDQGRSIVAAEIQAITYNEFLPALLGPNAPTAYAGYDSTVDPGVTNEFSTAAYRFGHSLLSPQLQRIGSNDQPIKEGAIDLKDAFFNPSALIATGVDPILRGASTQLAQELDVHVIDDVRNFLFGQPGAGGLDLPSLNIQRGRDHGLADYNSTRVALGLPALTTFSQISSDPAVVASLQATYGDVDSIDLWVGGLAEDHLPGSSMGLTFTSIIVDQFERLRTGDRFWYENVFSGKELTALQNTRLSDVIERNSKVRNLQSNLFLSSSGQSLAVHLDDLGIQKATIRAVNGQIQIIDGVKNRIVLTRPVEQLAGLVIWGSKYSSDRLTIEGSVKSTMLPQGIKFLAGTKGTHGLNIRGTSGNDTITVQGQDISLNGLDVCFESIDDLLIEGLAGNDHLSMINPGVAMATLDGGAGDDRLVGSDAADRLFGGDGDDSLYGGGGNDELYGGNGNDQLYGGGGADLLIGGAGLDLLIQNTIASDATAPDRFAAFLDENYAFTLLGNDFRNSGGRDERWFDSNEGKMFLTPDGNIYCWDGKTGANGVAVATVDIKFYEDLAGLCSPATQFVDEDSATSLADLAHNIDTSLGLMSNGGYTPSSGSRNEKWLRGNQGWYFITADGRLYKWDGLLGATGQLIAEFAPSYYLFPERLYSAS